VDRFQRVIAVLVQRHAERNFGISCGGLEVRGNRSAATANDREQQQ
jgi:hypothetical protein